MRHLRHLGWISLLLLLGCDGLLTQTRFFEFDLVHDGQPLTPGAPIQLDAGVIAELNVDLSEVDLYGEHQDEIESVDRAGLEATLAATAATRFSVYLSRVSGLLDPVNEATPLLRGLSVPANARQLEFDQVEPEIESLDALEEAVRAGNFQLYFVGEGAPLTLDALSLVVGFTVGL